MPRQVNGVRVQTATNGTGAVTLGSAIAGHLTMADAGAADGMRVSYRIVDGTASEWGVGVWASSGNTLTRSVVKSTNSNNLLNLSGSAEVFIVTLAEDLFVWLSPINANTTAVRNAGYPCDTSGGAFTLTLPSSPVGGDAVGILDAAGSFNINNLTISRNGSKIMGLSEDTTIDLKNCALTLVYLDSTNGWRIV